MDFRDMEREMEFTDVVKALSPKEMEDLLVDAFGSSGACPFVVENIRTVAGQKEVNIRYAATDKRRTITLGRAA
jgi:hypothetical protein